MPPLSPNLSRKASADPTLLLERVRHRERLRYLVTDFAMISFDNSGQKTDPPKWQSDPKNIARTSAIIKTLALEFSKAQYANVVTAIAPLNEPAGFKGADIVKATRQYWLDSYGNIRYPYGTSKTGDLMEVIHDAFQPLSYWDGFAKYPNFDGVLMDTHSYQVFSTPELQRTDDEHIQVSNTVLTAELL